jgi:hypothetical protein
MSLTQVPASMQEPNAQYTGFKNRIINGAMMIDQRNAGASVTVGAGDATWDVDRWMGSSSQASKFTLQQSTTVPTGFKNSMVATVASTITVGANDYAGILQRVEGLNTYDFGWGAAGAASVTVSFWVRSSVTGTYCVAIRNSGDTRSYVSTYTVNSANTWEQKSITIAGDTAGTWLTTNGVGLVAYFTLSCGSTFGSAIANTWSGSLGIATSSQTQWIQNSGATFYITGVQLEKGSTATSFDYRPYGTELALCQRYYEKSYDVGTALGTATGAGVLVSSMLYGVTTTNYATAWIPFKVTKRASPTMSTWDGLGNAGKGTRDNFGVSNQTNITATCQNIGTCGTQVYLEAGSAATGVQIHWAASSEL